MKDGETTGKFIDVNSMCMYYEEHGSGVPVVLLHGGYESSKIWEPCIPILVDQFRIITPDSRAHGRSNNPAGKLSYQQMADDIGAFIEILELDKPFVAGWSDGGHIALEFGMRYSDLARGLVVGGAWYTFTEQYLRAMKRFGVEGPGQLNVETHEKFLRISGLGDLVRPLHHHGPDYLNILAVQLTYAGMTNLDYSPDDFNKVTVPTLVVLGDRDVLIPVEQALHMYNNLPNAELSIIPKTGHHLTMTNPETFAAITRDFLVRHAPPTV